MSSRRNQRRQKWGRRVGAQRETNGSIVPFVSLSPSLSFSLSLSLSLSHASPTWSGPLCKLLEHVLGRIHYVCVLPYVKGSGRNHDDFINSRSSFVFFMLFLLYGGVASTVFHPTLSEAQRVWTMIHQAQFVSAVMDSQRSGNRKNQNHRTITLRPSDCDTQTQTCARHWLSPYNSAELNSSLFMWEAVFT